MLIQHMLDAALAPLWPSGSRYDNTSRRLTGRASYDFVFISKDEWRNLGVRAVLLSMPQRVDDAAYRLKTTKREAGQVYGYRSRSAFMPADVVGRDGWVAALTFIEWEPRSS